MPNATHGNTWTRRDFLRLSAGGAAAILALNALPTLALAKTSPAPKISAPKISLAECLAISPVEMAKRSALVNADWAFLHQIADEIADRQLHDTVLQILNNPAPTLLQRYPTAGDREMLRQTLVNAGLLAPNVAVDAFLPPCANPQTAPQPFFAAPGSGYMSHHSYPGGLVTHTAMNLRISLGLYEGYYQTFGYKLNRDVVIAAQMLHDLHKPWVFQWRDNGASLPEAAIAGTGGHHILGIAESVYRDLPAPVIIAQACAHSHPGTAKDEADVVNWLKAACIIAGKDPVQKKLLAPDGQTLPLPRSQEGFVTHLGDHDFVFTVPAALWMIAALKKIARQEFGLSDTDLAGKKFNAIRNYVFSQATIEHLYYILNTQGEDALTAAVKNMIAA